MSRPRKLSDAQWVDFTIARLGEGTPLYKIATDLGICRQTLQKYVAQNPAVDDLYCQVYHERMLGRLLELMASRGGMKAHPLALITAWERMDWPRSRRGKPRPRRSALGQIIRVPGTEHTGSAE